MSDRFRLRPAMVAGPLLGLAVVLAAWMMPEGIRTTLRERVYDSLLMVASGWLSPTGGLRIVIVDIDAASLDAGGPWPWRRERLAALFSAVLDRKPLAVGIDIVLAGPDTRSPAALARRLGVETGRQDLADLARTLVDGDNAIADAIRGRPAALGWVLDPGGDSAIPEALLFSGGGAPAAMWRSEGASGPPPRIADAAAGFGTVSIPGDDDGVARRIPLLVGVGAGVRPGLAAETLRLAAGASAYILAGEPPSLRIGDRSVALASDGLLRLLPRLPGAEPVILSADALLSGRGDASAIAGAIVFIGGSAAELGALRPSVLDPLTSSVALQAHAARQIAAGISPAPLQQAGSLEIVAALAMIGLAFAIARLLRPTAAIAALSGVFVSVAGGTLAAAANDILVDASLPLAAGVVAFVATSLGAFSETRRREASLRRRFSQHLAPGVVERIVADPESLRLKGERREITALFSDIEGFTATVRKVGPEDMISVLDSYFEGVAKIVTEHGGMIDKFVGDAVHAFFNMPFDLEDHPARALRCAIAVQHWTEIHRREGLAATIGLGRTRIGIETGDAVVGDVGLATKLDYTAHGPAVNMAARLEALNKLHGTAICIGPTAAARCGAIPLRSIGVVDVRDAGTVEVFTPA